jgi:hypothetical protein
MTSGQDRTIWFPKDSLLAVVLTIPLWAIAGLLWSLWMTYWMGGSLIGWLFVGQLWGVFVWFFASMVMLIVCRELATSIPLQETAALPEQLEEAAKSIRYTMEQLSPTSFVFKPRRGLARLLSWEFTKVHILLRDGRADLIGPVVLVKKMRKKLLASSSQPTP